MKKYKKYIFTFLTEILILLLGIGIYKLVSEKFSDTQFTEYNLFRRSMSLFQPIVMVGLGVAIPKFVSRYANRNSILSSSFILLLTSVFILGLLFFLNREYVAYLLFGSTTYKDFVTILILTLLGAGLHSIIYGFLRGKFLYGWANTIQLVNIGIVPVIAVVLLDDLNTVFFYTALAWIVISFFTFMILMSVYKHKIELFRIKLDFNRLIRFGLPRIPGDFALLLLISVPSFLVLHIYNDFILSGYVAFGTTLLNLVGAAFGPIGLILLPETNRYIKNKEIHKLNSLVKRILVLTVVITVFGILIFYLYSGFFTELLVSHTDNNLIISCRLMLLGSVGYALYLNLRSILDAFYFKPINSINLIISLIILTLLTVWIYLFELDFQYLLYAYIISVTFLGCITYYKVLQVFKK